MKTKLLRLVWSIFPWLIVAGIVAFIVVLGGRIQAEKLRLEAAKKAAINNDIAPTSVITLTLEPIRLEDRINLPGYVDPYEDLWVKAEVSGQVVNIPIKEGLFIVSYRKRTTRPLTLATKKNFGTRRRGS